MLETRVLCSRVSAKIYGSALDSYHHCDAANILLLIDIEGDVHDLFNLKNLDINCRLPYSRFYQQTC